MPIVTPEMWFREVLGAAKSTMTKAGTRVWDWIEWEPQEISQRPFSLVNQVMTIMQRREQTEFMEAAPLIS